MKKSRYKEEQIVSILREAESGTVTATARKHGVAEQTIYRWRRQFTGMEVSDVLAPAVHARLAQKRARHADIRCCLLFR